MNIILKLAIEELREYCSHYEKIAICGAGNMGRIAAGFLEEQHIHFDCFCATRRRKDSFEGRPVLLIDEISAGDMGIIVAVAKKNQKDVLAALEQRGLTFYCDDDFLGHLVWLECGEYMSEIQVEDGYLLRMRDVSFERDTLLVMPLGGIGDMLFFSGLMAAYKRENPGINRVCVLLRERHRDLAHLFAGMNEWIISDDLADLMIKHITYTGIDRKKNYICAYSLKPLDENGFLVRYRLSLGVRRDASWERPRLNTKCFGIKEQKRTIVIAPFTNSGVMLPEPFWEALIAALKERGYRVYTNLSSYHNERIREYCFEGTELINKNLMETVAFCEKCDAVIAVRSGLCDLMTFSETNLLILNTRKYWWMKNEFDRENLYELDCVSDFDNSGTVAKILDILDKGSERIHEEV